MKNKHTKPTPSDSTIFEQICNLIPGHLVPRLARETGADLKSRTFSCWSHVLALMFAQHSHSIGLNDVCDALQLNAPLLGAIRGATPPSRNGLSHANKHRPSELAEKLFWETLDHLGKQSPAFVTGKLSGRLHRFKVSIHVLDSTVIEMVASCLDWAKHRRRKAAAKTHMRLNLQNLLPQCVIIDTAREHDNKRARELCAGVQEGEIVLFDKAYVDYSHLLDLDKRGIHWVTRAKENMAYSVVESLPKSSDPKILSDEVVTLSNEGVEAPEVMRRVRALVEVDGVEREMVFLTNNLNWSPRSVADLYRARWQIEVFFKQVKQTLQVADFIGQSANAVRWQIWTAMLVYVLMRYLSFLSNWSHSFTRLFTILRGCLWRKFAMLDLLKSYGTAGGSFRNLAMPNQAYFAGFE